MNHSPITDLEYQQEIEEEAKRTTHEVKPIDLVVFSQASHVSNPLRHQAQELMRQADLHDLTAAQQILDAHGVEGQVIAINRDSSGKPVSISWQDKENHKSTVTEAA